MLLILYVQVKYAIIKNDLEPVDTVVVQLKMLHN